MKIEHDVVVITNYCTSAVPETLEQKEKEGYELVSVVMADTIYHVPGMYLFFKKVQN